MLSPTASNAPVRKDTHPAAQNVPVEERVTTERAAPSWFDHHLADTITGSSAVLA